MSRALHEADVAVIGGGLVGAAVAWGLARAGTRVVVLDEGDVAFRASRGNFALVWVQGKGLGMPEYSAWTKRSSDLWGEFARELKEQTGLDDGDKVRTLVLMGLENDRGVERMPEPIPSLADEHPAVDRSLAHEGERRALWRQAINVRQLNTKGLANRFGRSAQYFDGPRVEPILMGPGWPFMLSFDGDGSVRLRQLNGTQVASFGSYPWTAATVNQVVWCILQSQIFFTFPGMQPQVITWTINSTTFSIAPYTVLTLGAQKRAPFYRIAPHDITARSAR